MQGTMTGQLNKEKTAGTVHRSGWLQILVQKWQKLWAVHDIYGVSLLPHEGPMPGRTSRTQVSLPGQRPEVRFWKNSIYLILFQFLISKV
jgi:hypothetical protein